MHVDAYPADFMEFTQASVSGKGWRVVSPKVEQSVAPLAVGNPFPRFSWRLEGDRGGLRQVAYRIVVSDTRALRDATLWDSGWIEDCRSVGIRYQGAELTSRMAASWVVHVLDNYGRRSVSAPATFEMGLLSASDWRCEWIDAELPDDRQRRIGGESPSSESSILLRRQFELPSPVVRARLYITALGGYEASLNGERVGANLLAPEVATPGMAYYQTHDVTNLVRVGCNAIGVLVGDGYYAGGYYASMRTRYAFGPAPRRVCAMLVAEHADGRITRLGTDADWRLRAGPIESSSIYDGEHYDARKKVPGWDEPGHDDSSWNFALISDGEGQDVRRIVQIHPAIEHVDTLSATSVRQIDETTQVHDFGQNMAGWCRLQVRGGIGQELTLRFAERVYANGDVDMRNLRTAKCTDRYVLSGNPDGEQWQPSFTYHGFQYVSVSGEPVRTGKVELEAEVIGSCCELTGELSFPESPMLQKLWQNAWWSQRSNLIGIPTDNAQRSERAGWLGDIQLFLESATFNMDVCLLVRRHLADIRASQMETGEIVCLSPHPVDARLQGSPGWSDACVILPWALYLHYGDDAVIEENWEAMERWMAFVESRNPDRLWREGCGFNFGDWLSVDVEGTGNSTPKLLCSTAYWGYSAGLMAQMARALGEDESAERYETLKAEIARAFAREFISDDGYIGNDSQTGYVLSLHFGLVPEAIRTHAAERLVAAIKRCGTRLSTGMLGTAYLLDVLADNGYRDVTVDLLLQIGYPSWGYMVEQGASTIWECWNAKDAIDLDGVQARASSLNHYALGAYTGFMYRRLAGIAPRCPGFRHLSARPLFDPRIGTVRAHYDSVVGRIESCVQGDADGLKAFDLRVPANALADLELPVGTWRDENTGMAVEVAHPGQVMELVSGAYAFRKAG